MLTAVKVKVRDARMKASARTVSFRRVQKVTSNVKEATTKARNRLRYLLTL